MSWLPVHGRRRQHRLHRRRWQRHTEQRNWLVFSRHTRDLGIFGLAAGIVAGGAIAWILKCKIYPEILVPVIIGALGWTVAQLWERGNKRANLAEIFGSEIISFLEMIKRSELVDVFFSLYVNPLQELRGFSGGPRVSDYFQIYGNNNDELGFLNRKAARNIMEFYTYLKGARDAATAFDKWESKTGAAWKANPSASKNERNFRKGEVANVLLLLEVMTIAGIKALDEIIDSPRKERRKVLAHAYALRADLYQSA